MKLLGAATQKRNNNFNLLRIIAAILVLLSHSWPITQGTASNEPGMSLFGVEMGRMAVWLFFALSGHLVAGSWDRKPQLGAFFVARARRIFPGLLVMLILLTFLLGAVVSTEMLSNYLMDRDTWRFFLNNLLLFKLEWTLPGVFDGAAVNGSLWTLPVEIRCYIALGFLGYAGLLERRSTYFVAIALIIFLSSIGTLDATHRPLVVAFAAGVCGWKCRERLLLDGRAALVGLALGFVILRTHVPEAESILATIFAYSALCFGYVADGRIRKFNRIGDYSYGIYIYAFPIQITIHAMFPTIGVLAMFILALPVTLVFAMLSWHFVESVALRKSQASRISN